MYKIGDYIMYDNTGVCKVIAIGPYYAQKPDNKRLYYTITPIYTSEKIYVPVDSSIFMRPIINKETANNLIEQIPSIEDCALSEFSKTLLNQHYKSIFSNHDCISLIQLIKGIYKKEEIALQNKKTLSQTDKRYMKLAEDILYGEFSIALDIPRDKVVTYIETVINNKKN